MNKMKQWLPKDKITKGVKRNAHVKQSLPQIEGIDSAAAIRMIGNEDIFWSILKDYCRIIPQKINMIQEYYDTQNWKGYTIEVHALKSSSRQIGATALAKKAELLEKAGNELDLDTITRDTQAALDEYQHYYEILSPYFTVTHNEATEELTDEILNGVFAEIEHAIEELDMDLLEEAVQRLDTYKLDAMHSEYYNKMRKAVDDMDAYACEDIMTEWKETLSDGSDGD